MNLSLMTFIVGILVAIVAGALIALLWFAFYNLKLRSDLKKFDIPKKPEEITQWIKENKEELKDAGKSNLQDIKEVVLDEQRRNNKFREFEKLRKLAETDTAIPRNDVAGKPNPVSSYYDRQFKATESTSRNDKSKYIDFE